MLERFNRSSLKGEVQITDPQSAGTAYTAMAAFVQLWGEEKAFDFLKHYIQTYHNTPNQVSPRLVMRRGETAVGIRFLTRLRT